MNNYTVLPIAQLKAAEYNPRRMAEDKFTALKIALHKYGLVEPIVVNMEKGREYTIVGGHQRVRAAKDLGWEEIECRIVHLKEDDEKAMNIGLNEIEGEFVEDMLARMVRDLNKSDVDLAATGLTDYQVSRLLDSLIEEDEEEEEDAVDIDAELAKPAEPDSKLGTIYEIGPHRIMCGDSTDPGQVAALMNGVQADIVFTDPPYNVDYESEKTGKIMNDKMSPEHFRKFSQAFFGNYAEHLKRGGTIYVCTGYSSYPLWYYVMANAGFYFSQNIIWVKNAPAMTFGDYNRQYEQIIKAKQASPAHTGGGYTIREDQGGGDNLWLARGRVAPFLRLGRSRRLDAAAQGTGAHGSPDGETRVADYACPQTRQQDQRPGARSVRRIRIDTHGSPQARPPRLRDGAGPEVLRHHPEAGRAPYSYGET